MLAVMAIDKCVELMGGLGGMIRGVSKEARDTDCTRGRSYSTSVCLRTDMSGAVGHKQRQSCGRDAFTGTENEG